MGLWNAIDDARLSSWARRAARGDRDAFTRLYRGLYPPVFAYVARRVQPVADAEDLVGRIFVRIVEHLPRYESGRGTARGWALTIARNQVIDHLRTRRDLVGIDDASAPLADAAPSPDARLEDDERMRAVRASIEALPADDREVVGLRYGDGLSIADIAAMTDRSVDATKQRLSRAVRRLKAAHADPSTLDTEAAAHAL